MLVEVIDLSDCETVFHLDEDGRLDEAEVESAVSVTCCTPGCLEDRRCGATFDSLVVDRHDDPIPLNASLCNCESDF